MMSDDALVRRLEPPGDEVSLVIDTDAYNEIDDQYALSYALLSANLTVEAVYAAPFANRRASGPAAGMERSYEEVLRLTEKLAALRPGLSLPVLRGSSSYLVEPDEPIASDAAEDLVRRAMDERRTGPLYIVAIGAPTNIASALLLQPSIRDRVVVVWLGGQPYTWHTAWEFNLKQDLAASKILFDSGVPLVHIPCKNVAEHLRVSPYELLHFLHGRNPVAEYLYEITTNLMEEEKMLTKVIWDVAPVAWLRRQGFILSHLIASPILTDQYTWSFDPQRHLVRVAYDLDRDAIFGDLFALLGQMSAAR